MWLWSKGRSGQFAYKKQFECKNRQAQGQHKAEVKQTHMLDITWKELDTLETPLFHSSVLSSQVNKLWHKTRPKSHTCEHIHSGGPKWIRQRLNNNAKTSYINSSTDQLTQLNQKLSDLMSRTCLKLDRHTVIDTGSEKRLKNLNSQAKNSAN